MTYHNSAHMMERVTSFFLHCKYAVCVQCTIPCVGLWLGSHGYVGTCVVPCSLTFTCSLQGADPNQKDSQGFTPLHWATRTAGDKYHFDVYNIYPAMYAVVFTLLAHVRVGCDHSKQRKPSARLVAEIVWQTAGRPQGSIKRLQGGVRAHCTDYFCL